MRHVTVNYVPPGPGAPAEARLRRMTCLVENADRMGRLGLAAGPGLDVVLVGGAGRLSPGMLEALRAGGCRIHDADPAYAALVRRFPRVVEAFGGPWRVHVFGFLRWLVVDALFPGEPVLCYDGDTLHNVPLARLGDAFAGVTRTATSTCFAAIADRAWFRGWAQGLAQLEQGVESFFAPLAAQLRGAGCRMRSSPEEFFAKILIERGDLPQDPLPPGFPLWVVPQPHLLPRLWNFVRIPGGPERVPSPMRYRREGGIDCINDLPVAFWHLQKPFLSQLGACSHQRRLPPSAVRRRCFPFSHYGNPPSEALARGIDPYHDEGGFPLDSPPQEAQERARELLEEERRARAGHGDGPGNPFGIRSVYREYFVDGDLSPLFNDDAWPRPGAWRVGAAAEGACAGDEP